MEDFAEGFRLSAFGPGAGLPGLGAGAALSGFGAGKKFLIKFQNEKNTLFGLKKLKGFKGEIMKMFTHLVNGDGVLQLKMVYRINWSYSNWIGVSKKTHFLSKTAHPHIERVSYIEYQLQGV